MLGIFVTGTDTDAGKTVITAGLLRALLKRRINAAAVKAVQTGAAADAFALDAESYIRALPAPYERDIWRARTWLSYNRACSPHLAAEEEDRPVHLEDFSKRLAAFNEADLILVEGSGGVHSPLSRHVTMADLMERMGLPVLLVAANRLGVISQTLLALEALHNRGLEVLGVILNRPTPPSRNDDSLMLADHALTIPALGHVEVLADIPWLMAPDGPDWDTLADWLAPVAERIVLHSSLSSPVATSTASPSALLAFDRVHLWHPYTSAVSPLPCHEAVSASGTRIRLRDGRELTDGMASWWCAIHGYGHTRILAAVRQQLGRMPHVMFGGLTHAPAVRLAELLLSVLPSGLKHIFLSDSGSVAVEVALKMAVQYWQGQGQRQKTRFITPCGGYHGDTFGAMSVCDPVIGMHNQFAGLLAQQIFVERPSCRFDAPFDPVSLNALEQAVRTHAHECAAVILEPIVQGAGGMWMYHPEYLIRARALCSAHDLLLICDEIATGFGRTGELFAVNWAKITPDILCLGKALTGGVMSLAATCATSEVAHGISVDGGVFMHGPTFMGNPLACAAASASLELLCTGAWREQISALQTGLLQGLEPCREHPEVTDVRVLGGIGVVELRQPVDTAVLQDFFVRSGVWIRPFGRLIYLMPPYVSGREEVALLTAAVCSAVREKC